MPNIVFILADDLGIGDVGSYGQTKNKTPHLDRMADEGMRFTRFMQAVPHVLLPGQL
jgi:arylsulfatase A